MISIESSASMRASVCVKDVRTLWLYSLASGSTFWWTTTLASSRLCRGGIKLMSSLDEDALARRSIFQLPVKSGLLVRTPTKHFSRRLTLYKKDKQGGDADKDMTVAS